MNGRFRFTPEAEAQLVEIIDYIAADSEDAILPMSTDYQPNSTSGLA